MAQRQTTNTTTSEAAGTSLSSKKKLLKVPQDFVSLQNLPERTATKKSW
jgi:hypothetical protein